MDAQRDERSLGQLFGDLSRQLSTLVRQEIDLARTEVTTKASAATRDAALVGVGGALAYAGLLVLLGAAVLLLVEVGLDPWLAALIVGVVVAAIGGFLAMRGRDGLQNADLAPKRTIETLKDDADWAKERIK
jgi:VIT1/CCC1 family predicted Fe2+/Mn2+ transporter